MSASQHLCRYCGQPITDDLHRKLEARFAKEQAEQLEAARAQAKREAKRDQQKLLDAAVKSARAEDAEKLAKARAADQKKIKDLQANADQRVIAERAAAAEKITAAEQKSRAETQRLKKQVADMKRQLDEQTTAQRKQQAERGLLEILTNGLKNDLIRKIRDGANGADVLHTVRDDDGRDLGSILYEAKDVKDWKGGWIGKLLADQEREGADYAVLVTETMPVKGDQHLQIIDDVIVTTAEHVLFVAVMLRRELIKRQPGVEASDERRDELFRHMLGKGQEHLDGWKQLNDESRKLTQAIKNLKQKKRESARPTRRRTRGCLLRDASRSRRDHWTKRQRWRRRQ